MLAINGSLGICVHQTRATNVEIRVSSVCLIGCPGSQPISTGRAPPRVVLNMLLNPFFKVRYEPIFSLGCLFCFYLSSMKPPTRDN